MMEIVQNLSVEVERKFPVPPDIQERLTDLGATLIEDVTFVDMYFDTEDSALSKADLWLRKRGDKWQLKYPPSTRLDSSVCQYHEISDEALIVQLLYDRLHFPPGLASIASVLDAVPLQNFAMFTTNRQTYHKENVTIDIDKTNFGYAVGEIEVIASNTADIGAASAKVDGFMKQLGLLCDAPCGSKLEHFLSLHNPKLLGTLRELGVL